MREVGMRKRVRFRAGIAFGLLSVAGLAGVGVVDDPSALYAAAAPPPAVEVTSSDIAMSNAKVRMAHGALSKMWAGHFRDVGQRFAVPGIMRYRGGAASSCGIMRRNNAGYCPTDNTIYFDEVFVAAQAKEAGRSLGTDGDMAAVGIIAHEMGHAVSLQLGYRSRSTYAMEATADCLAGAFTDRAERDGSLEAGDIEEAFFGMAAAGDPAPELTGDARIDRRILRVAAVTGHGTREQRTENFRRGLEGGAGACLDEFST